MKKQFTLGFSTRYLLSCLMSALIYSSAHAIDVSSSYIGSFVPSHRGGVAEIDPNYLLLSNDVGMYVIDIHGGSIFLAYQFARGDLQFPNPPLIAADNVYLPSRSGTHIFEISDESEGVDLSYVKTLQAPPSYYGTYGRAVANRAESKVFVANNYAVQAIDTSTNALIRQISVSNSSPSSLALSNDEQTLYAVNDLGELYIIDTETFVYSVTSFVVTAGERSGFDPDIVVSSNGKIWVSWSGIDGISGSFISVLNPDGTLRNIFQTPTFSTGIGVIRKNVVIPGSWDPETDKVYGYVYNQDTETLRHQFVLEDDRSARHWGNGINRVITSRNRAYFMNNVSSSDRPLNIIMAEKVRSAR